VGFSPILAIFSSADSPSTLLASQASLAFLTSALLYGGPSSSPYLTNTESWDGTSWTEVADLSTGRYGIAGAGADNTSALGAGGYSVPVTAATEEYTSPVETAKVLTD